MKLFNLGAFAGPRRRRGFTLIELLVVIAIIALLIGILLPALGAARESARNLKCSTSQRSLSQGMLMHANDFDGYFYDLDYLPREDLYQNGRRIAVGGPTAKQNGALRFAPAEAILEGSASETAILGPNYRNDQFDQSNNTAYWGVRYDAYLMDNAPHKNPRDLPQRNVPRSQRTAGGPSTYIEYNLDYTLASEDPEAFTLLSWEITSCPSFRYISPRYILELPIEPYGKYSTYGINGVTVSDRQSAATGAGGLFDEFNKPRNVASINFNIIMFHDSVEPWMEGGSDTLQNVAQDRGEDTLGLDEIRQEYFRHSGKCNAALLDGSVTSYDSEFPELGVAPYVGIDPTASNGGSGVRIP